MAERGRLPERAVRALRHAVAGPSRTPPPTASDEINMELIETLDEALRRLPELTREVFLLHRFDGLNYTRVAHRLSMSVNEVEQHIANALDRLDRALSALPDRRGGR